MLVRLDFGVAEVYCAAPSLNWPRVGRLLKSERRARCRRVVYNDNIYSNLGDNDDNVNSWFIERV